MSVAPYPEYKDSGVEWVGTIPSHWQVAPLMTVATEVEERNFDLKNKNLLSLSYGRIIIKDIDSNDGLLPESFESYQVLKPNDIVLRLTDLQNDKRSLRTALCRHSGIITSAYLGLRPVPGFSLYLSQLLHSYDITKVFYSLGGGLRQTIKFDDVRRLPILIPPSHEQATIAAFLDQETDKIDALVAEQERLIALLKEKRQAVISQAVTKGLNPNAPMKDSGIEWLGQVPAHWEVKRIGALFAEANQEGELDLPVLSVSIHDGVSDRELADEELDRKVSRSEDRTKYKKVQPGDLVYNMMRAWQGGFGTVTVHGMVSPAYVVARPQDFVRAAFIEMLLRTPFAVEEMRRHSRGVTDFRLRLYWDEFKQINVPLPTTDEQDQILQGVQEIMAQGDTLITEATQAITLLRERRAALISAAVTGKIDVRSLTPTKQEAA